MSQTHLMPSYVGSYALVGRLFLNIYTSQHWLCLADLVRDCAILLDSAEGNAFIQDNSVAQNSLG